MRTPGIKRWEFYTITEKLVALQDHADREADPEYKTAMDALRSAARERRKRAQKLREIALRICQMRGIRYHDKHEVASANGSPAHSEGQPDSPRIQAHGVGGISVEISPEELPRGMRDGDGGGHHHPEHSLGSAGEDQSRRKHILDEETVPAIAC